MGYARPSGTIHVWARTYGRDVSYTARHGSDGNIIVRQRPPTTVHATDTNPATQSDISQSPPQFSRKRECAPRCRETMEEFGADFAVSRNPETVSGTKIRRIRRRNRLYSAETLLG